MRGSRGGTEVPDPIPSLKNHKNIRFLSNTGLDPLKNHKATKPDSMLGHRWHASEMPFKWHFAGGPMMANLFESYLPSSTKKNVKVGHPLTKLSGSAHGHPVM